ncbi:putative ATP-dependent RNA helicase [Auxenochlorella protothecoides]|uniref:RNA helicase n=1 Tax=Auxenochlorella protothecoides TaxID=3075 RepID=A0A087SIJ6_AUXPR|nr:putative ATP-dependent RNA helicase [Auxenochlorella protothecoides]KFM25550.1 putative ATP-dependent RNA helicase [Auxenochlorella protothecoides]
MRRLTSKRQRKQKNKISLSSKQFKAPIGLTDGDDAEQELPFDSNALILPAMGGTCGQKEEEPAEPVAKPLSKSQKRKARRVQEEKERRSARDNVLQSLSQTALDPETLQALRPLAARGQKETRKEVSARRQALRAAGHHVEDDDVPTPRHNPNSESDVGSSDDSSSEEEATPRPSSAPARTQFAPRRWDEPQSPQEEAQPALKKARTGGEESGSDTAPHPPLAQALAQARQQLGLGDGLGGADEDEGPARLAPSVPRENLPHPRSVSVERRPEIQAAREGLPILGMEQEIMELLAEHDVVVLSGETGCGKTTQVPQFLLEAGFGCPRFPERAGAVGITQPRRIGAISTAERVADELGSRLGDVVGYQVRYDRSVGDATALKFMTDGILLRELQHDFLLPHYSAILVDEAHERSLNTDILLGLLSRVVSLRRQMHSQQQQGPGGVPVWPLKLVIMSATLRVEDFVGNQRLFPRPPPLITVPARQYPVTVHFSRRTEMNDYVGAAHRKVAQIHRQLPPGGILVFLTGQAEVKQLCKQLETTFKAQRRNQPALPASAPPEEAGDIVSGGDAAEEGFGADAIDFLDAEAEDLDDFDDGEDEEEEEEVDVMGGAGFTPEQLALAEAEFEKRLGLTAPAPAAPSRAAQGPGPVHVVPLFAMLPAAGQAEVFRPAPPGHRLVIVATNVAETSLTIPGIRYVVDAGRAKQRVLESTASGMARYEVGWVSQASAAQRAGRAGRTGPGHAYRLFSSAVFNDAFPAHAAPEILGSPQESVVLSLKSMGVARVHNFPFPTPPEPSALRAAVAVLTTLGALRAGDEELTPLGRAMAALPVNPRHARMLLHAASEGGRAAGLLDAGVALAAALSAALRDQDSDGLSALRALCAYLAHGRDAGWAAGAGLHARHLEEAVALRAQLARVLTACPVDGLGGDHAGYSSRAVRYQAAELEEPVFLHPLSGLHRAPPAFLLYTDLVRTAKRPYVSGVTALDPAWLPATAAALCSLSAPLPAPAPFYSPARDAVLAWHEVTFGRHGWAMPRTAAPHPDPAERCARFAAALLEGRRAGVDSRRSLLAALLDEPGFLLRELRAWYPAPALPILQQAWAALLEEACREGVPA